jgi:cobalt-zinc-cadmium efflux system protein
MNHEHHNHNISTSNIKNIKLALFINFTFTIIELVGGILANSVAIISNAVHDLGDTVALSFSYFSERFASHKTSNDNYTYGLNRLPLLSAFINSVILLVGSIFILYNTIPRLFKPESPKADLMIVIAVVGVIANGIALYRLRKNVGLNSKVMGLHLLEDVLGWASVLIGGIMIKFFNLRIIDPILSIAITIYILFNVIKNLRSAFQLFMQKSPSTLDSNEILFKIKEDRNILSVEDFHIWSLEGTQHVLSAHIKVKDSITPADMIALKSRIRDEIKKYGDIHSTIEFEYESENCNDHC